jgi:hypothetical protein
MDNHGRLQLVAEQDQPVLAWHDQDRAVEEGRHDQKPSVDSLGQLGDTEMVFQDYVRALPEGAWDRVGVHAKAGEVRPAAIAIDS